MAGSGWAGAGVSGSASGGPRLPDPRDQARLDELSKKRGLSVDEFRELADLLLKVWHMRTVPDYSLRYGIVRHADRPAWELRIGGRRVATLSDFRLGRWKVRVLRLLRRAAGRALRLELWAFSHLPPRLRPASRAFAVAAYLWERETWQRIMAPSLGPPPLIYGPSPMQLEVSAFNASLQEQVAALRVTIQRAEAALAEERRRILGLSITLKPGDE